MASAALRKVVVFGGNGFVGSEVLKLLASMSDVAALSVARRGGPSWSADLDVLEFWQFSKIKRPFPNFLADWR